MNSLRLLWNNRKYLNALNQRNYEKALKLNYKIYKEIHRLGGDNARELHSLATTAIYIKSLGWTIQPDDLSNFQLNIQEENK